MSKPIKMTEQYMAECRADFEKALQLTKLADGKLSFTKVFTCGDRKATVFFTAGAWAKMALLIKEFDKEVAWHGVAHRAADEAADEYIIEDIVVYPQEVSGTTVEMDTEKYAEWLMQNADDERFNNIHMQGHSHVNMATSPSSVDLNHQEEILNMLGDDDFYIFMIWNKSFVSTNKIYDLKKNVLFEDKDITVKLEGEHEGLAEFLKNAKDMVKQKNYSFGGYGNYGGYGGYGGNYQSHSGAPYNPLPGGKKEEKDNKDSKKPDKKADKKSDEKKPDKKTEKASEKPRTRIGAGWQGKNACQQSMWDEDEDYPYPYGGYSDQYLGGE